MSFVQLYVGSNGACDLIIDFQPVLWAPFFTLMLHPGDSEYFPEPEFFLVIMLWYTKPLSSGYRDAAWRFAWDITPKETEFLLRGLRRDIGLKWTWNLGWKFVNKYTGLPSLSL